MKLWFGASAPRTWLNEELRPPLRLMDLVPALAVSALLWLAIAVAVWVWM